jgi:drug/metabolite transporter (DMT)-like permease
MKLGLYDSNNLPLLKSYHVAALRMFSAGLVLLPFGLKAWRQTPANLRKYVFLSGIMGSFIPAFLFCLAETKIDSALAGMLNSLTPIFVLIIAMLFYKKKFAFNKKLGIGIALVGCILLFLSKAGGSSFANLGYAGFAVLACIFYGYNVNMVQNKLHEVGSFNIATLAFSLLVIPSALVLMFTGYFSMALNTKPLLIATAASCTLGIFGTAIASVLFYMLVKRAGGLFTSMVTFGIPFVAVGWGIIYHETVTIKQILSLIIILAGVYVANRVVKGK